jgi:hypothetical protein
VWGECLRSLASATSGILLLVEIKRNVSILDHMLDLATHGNGKQDTKVNEKDGPIDRDIKDAEEATE